MKPVISCTPSSDVGPYFARLPRMTKKDNPMLADTAATVEVAQLNLPPDLLHEVSRHSVKGNTENYRIESLKPSFFGRLLEKLVGG